jgi:riboflavin biosynthesis pyrimidine reductase
VGIPGEEAKTKILADNPKLHVIILPVGSIITLDYSFNRVRIVVDDSGLVVQIPTIG